MQIKKTSAENIEELMEIRLEMLREVNGLAPDAAFDSDLVAHSREYFLHGEQTTVFAMDGEKIAGCASISYITVMQTFDHPTGRRAHLMNIYTRASTCGRKSRSTAWFLNAGSLWGEVAVSTVAAAINHFFVG